VTVHDAGEKPSPDYRPPAVLPEEEEEKIAFEEEEEAVEFWMLEKKPRAIKRVMPTYPDSARKALIEGKVTVRALLDGEGKVERIDRIEGPFVFHQATATAFRQWEFTPAV
jgi:outer membrane biosynthesis protein TonB